MRASSFAIISLSTLIHLASVQPNHAADWPQFRGGAAQGRSADASFAGDPKIAWQVTMPGSGWSQPIVFEKTIYLTTAVADPPIVPKNFARGVADPRSMPGSKAAVPEATVEWRVIALDLESGNSRWSATASSGKPKYAIHPSNSYATESTRWPTHRERRWILWSVTGTAAAFDHYGKTLCTVATARRASSTAEPRCGVKKVRSRSSRRLRWMVRGRAWRAQSSISNTSAA